MPEYLAPGVYVEETSFRAKSIEGVGTSTTAFVGPTRKGPFRAGDDTPETPELLTSYGDFERIYGGFDDLALGGWQLPRTISPTRSSVSSTKGGSRLYVSRVVGAGAASAAAAVRGGARRRAGAVRGAFPRRGRQRRRHRARTTGARIAGDNGDGASRHTAALGSGGGAGASPQGRHRVAAGGQSGEPRRRSADARGSERPDSHAVDGRDRRQRRSREPRQHGVRPHASPLGRPCHGGEAGAAQRPSQQSLRDPHRRATSAASSCATGCSPAGRSTRRAKWSAPGP